MDKTSLSQTPGQNTFTRTEIRQGFGWDKSTPSTNPCPSEHAGRFADACRLAGGRVSGSVGGRDDGSVGGRIGRQADGSIVGHMG